jgi:hypothetical protein
MNQIARVRLFAALFLAVASLANWGCTQQRVGGTRDATALGYSSEGAVANLLTVDKDGQTTQEYAGEPPAAVIADSGGVENYGAVPFGTVSALLPGGTSLVASVPNDFGADSVDITLGDGSVVRLGGVRISTSEVVIARAEFLTRMAPVIAGWTAEQRAALVAELETQAKLGDTFATSVLPFIKALVVGG